MDSQAKANESELATVRQVLAAFVSHSGSATIRPVRGGLSGSGVFVCEVDQRKFAMKRWPIGTRPERVDEVHGVMIQARQSLALVPELVRSTFASPRVAYEGYQYELAQWMEGSAISDRPESGKLSIPGMPIDREAGCGPTGLVLAAVEAGGEAIARFHDSVRKLAGPMVPAPAVLRRLGRIEQLTSELPQAIRRAEAFSPVLSAAAKWLDRQGASRLDAAHHVLGQWVGRIVPTQMVLRDVHRQHILYQDSVVTAVVDFDAVGVDTVATDLARWVSDFAEKPADLPPLVTAALAGYRRFASISDCESDLVSAISEASTIILLANWVVWLGLGQRNFSGCNDLVDRRVGDLMRRIGAVESMVAVR